MVERPIVAFVPVGAVDSTLGEVTQAYSMVLPSISDAGSDKVVISPFTSLLSNVISKAKDSAGLVEDLTVAEGCREAGDDLATKVS